MGPSDHLREQRATPTYSANIHSISINVLIKTNIYETVRQI